MDNEINTRRRLGTTELHVKLAALEGTQNAIKEQIASIFQGETFFFKKIQWFSTIVLGIFALGGLFAYVVNTNKLTDSIELNNKKVQNTIDDLNSKFQSFDSTNTKKFQELSDTMKRRLDEMSGRAKITSAYITNLKGESDILKVHFSIEPEWLGPLLTYREYFRFNVKISVSGSGIADYRGFTVQSDSEIINNVASQYYGRQDAYIEKFRNGTTIYGNRGEIIPGSPVETYFEISRTRRTCEDAENDFKMLSDIKDLGEMNIGVIIANVQTGLPSQKFRLTMGDNTSIYPCDELVRRLNNTRLIGNQPEHKR
ncbi:MAG: hypothetical protein AB7H90_03570 [Alphaproteobacteria bacterium]